MNKRSVRDLDVGGKRVLVRVDFNVPVKDGEVTDDTRIRRALPTIRHLLQEGARPVLISHLGRPKGEPDPEYAMDPVAARLCEVLGWYDNEWGYSNRTCDLAAYMGDKL